MTDMHLTIVHSSSELEIFSDAIADLDANSSEANPFVSPQFLLPALRYLQGKKVAVALLWRGDSLLALLPFERRSLYRGLPLPHLRFWEHQHCFYGAPLVRNDCELLVAETVVAEIARLWPLALGLELRVADRQSTAFQNFERAAPNSFLTGEFCRPIRSIDESRQHSEPAHMKAKELRRKQRRLAEHGAVTFAALSPGDELTPWLDRFVGLEDSGWKHRSHSSLSSTERDSLFFRDMCKNFHALGRLRITELRVDTTAVASQVIIEHRNVAFMFKIAFDERLAATSPGFQLLHWLGTAGFPPEIELIDSCVTAEDQTVCKAWGTCRDLAHLFVPRRGIAGGITAAILRGASTLKRRWCR